MRRLTQPAALDSAHVARQLHRLLCLVRILNTCFAHAQRTARTPLPDALAARALETVLALMQPLLLAEEGGLPLAGAEAPPAAGSPPDTDRTRTFSFVWKDTEAQRERECEYALLDAGEGVRVGEASPTAYFVIVPRSEDCAFAAPLHGAYETPADESDAPARVVAAYLYRALGRLVFYLAQTNAGRVQATVAGALQRAPSAADEHRAAAEIRLMEYARLDLGQLVPLAASTLPALNKRGLYAVVSVAIRRAILHTLPHGTEWASGVFDALLHAADAPRRRTLLWPTLATLLGLCGARELDALVHARSRRELAHAKKAAFLDTLVHQLGSSKLGLLATYALCTCCYVYTKTQGPGARPFVAMLLASAAPRVLEWARSAPQLSVTEVRLLARLLADMLAHDACRAAAHAAAHAAAQTPLGALVVVHALLIGGLAAADGARAVLPALRARVRALPVPAPASSLRERRAWPSALHPPQASVEQAFVHALLQYALMCARAGADAPLDAADVVPLLRQSAPATLAAACVHHAAARLLYTLGERIPPDVLQHAAARVLQADSATALRHEVQALAYLVRCVPRGACDAELTRDVPLGAALYALCVLDASVHRAALALAAALGAAVAEAPELVRVLAALPPAARPEATGERVCRAVQPSPAARVALRAVLALWQPLVVAGAGGERALRLYAHFLAAAADRESEALVAPLAALVLRADAAASDAAHVLLVALPAELVAAVVRRVRDAGAPDTRATAARWLWLLETLAARAEVPVRHELVAMLAQCAERAAPATQPDARVSVCRTAHALCTHSAGARAALALRILPWADAAQADVRAAALQALVPLTRAPVEAGDALDESADAALDRRLALYVHGLLRAVRRADDLADAHTAVAALTQLVEAHPAFVQAHASRLVLRTHPLERAAVLHACAAAWAAVPAAPARDAAPLTPALAQALVHRSGAPAGLEEALAAAVPDEAALVAALLGEEVARGASETALLRANTPGVAVATAFLRRASFTGVRRLVRAAVACVEACDAPLDADTPEGRAALVAAADTLVDAAAPLASQAADDVRRVCAAVRAHAARRFPGTRAPSHALSTLFVLRVLGPALATPEALHVALPERASLRRELVLLGKVFLGLAQGGFAAHHTALAALNPQLQRAEAQLAAILDGLCDAPPPAPRAAPRAVPLADRAFLAALLEEHGEALAAAHPALAPEVHAARSALAAPTYAARRARALAAHPTYDALLRAHRGRDTAALHGVFYEAHVDGRRVVCYAAARLAAHRADLALLAHHVLHVLGAGGACDVLLDLSGASEAHLPPMQFVVYLLAVAPRAVLAQARTLVVLNASTAVRHFLRAWAGAEVPWPGRVAFATTLAEVAPLAPAGVLPPATYALLHAAAAADETVVTLHDGRLAPALATISVRDAHVVLTTTHAVPLGASSGRTCDILALADVGVARQGATLVLTTPTDTLYVGSARAAELADAVRAAQARRATVPGGPPRAHARAPRAVLHAAALWHAGAEQVAARAAAAALLRAAEEPAPDAAALVPSYTLPHAVPTPAVPSATYAAAMVHTALDLCAACSAESVAALRHVAPLVPRVAHAEHVDARALLAGALMVWAARPALRPALRRGVWDALEHAPALHEPFLEACLEVAPGHGAAPLLYAVLDALAAVPAAPLHTLLLARVQRALHDAVPAWDRVAVLVHLLAARILRADQPVAPHLPTALALVLLLAHRTPFLHAGVAHAAHNTLFALQRDAGGPTTPAGRALAPLLPRIARALATPDAHALAAAACDVLAAAAAAAAAPHTRTDLVRAVAHYTAHGAARAPALTALAALPDAGEAEVRAAAHALACPDAEVAAAAAACAAAHVGAAPRMAPALLWAGLALVQTGDAALLAPGVGLAHAAAAHLHGDLDALLAARHSAEPTALDAAYGVHGDRDLGFTLAAVLRTPLTTAATAPHARELAHRLLTLLAPADGSLGTRQRGLLLALAFTAPADLDAAAAAARVAPALAADACRSVPAGSTAPLAIALGASLVPHVALDALEPLCQYLVHASETSAAGAALLHGPLAPFWDAAPHAPAVPALRALQRRRGAPDGGGGAQLLPQLGFAALLPPARPPPATECRAWLQRLVAFL